MDTDRRQHADGLGWPAIAVILLLGGALSVLIALDLRRQLVAQVSIQTLTRAQSIARVAESEINELHADLKRRAAYWSETKGAGEQSIRIQIFMEENPALLAVLYPATAEYASKSPEAEQILRAWQVEDPPADSLSGTSALSDGRRVVLVNLRATFDSTDAVPILAAYDPKQLLQSMLAETAGEYDFSIRLGAEPLLAQAAAPSTASLAALAREVAIVPEVGEPWTMLAWPTPAALPPSFDQGPLTALGAGLLATALVAGVLHLGTLGWRRRRLLDEALAALERQVEETRSIREENRETSSELEARVTERTAELNETIAELQTFIYSVSHDLRSPLAAVINFSAIFAEDYAGRLDAMQTEYLSRISASAASAVGLMDALLSYSHSGRAELRRVRLDVDRMVGELCDEAVAAQPERPFSVKIGDLPDAFADESMLRFVFANLISNACKFAKPGECASIEIGGRRDSTENVYFVRDEGIGFDPRFEQKLFRAFERLHRSDEYEGHGVGLAIAARMVRRHGGRIWAQGAEGKGATFSFSIPARRGNGDGHAAA